MSEWEGRQGWYSVPVRLVIPRIRNYILKIVGLKGTIVFLWVVARVKTYIITCDILLPVKCLVELDRLLGAAIDIWYRMLKVHVTKSGITSSI